jgi:hypothetical protein
LPEKINYNLGLQFFVSNGETDEIVVFDKDTDMSDKDLELYFNDQSLDGINISNVKNINTLSITNVNTDTIYLPKKVKVLQTENIESSDSVEMAGLKELEKLEMEIYGFEFLNFTYLEKLETLEITDRNEYEEEAEEAIRDTKIFKIAKEVNYIYEDHNTGEFVTKTLKSKPSDAIKFSLAEEENGGISNFLEGLPFTEQWIVARDIDNAIKNSKIADGTKVTFNVPSRSKMSDKSTAYFIIQKVAEGYNDFEFKVKKNATGPLTAQVLAALDFKSKKYQEQVERNNNIEKYATILPHEIYEEEYELLNKIYLNIKQQILFQLEENIYLKLSLNEKQQQLNTFNIYSNKIEPLLNTYSETKNIEILEENIIGIKKIIEIIQNEFSNYLNNYTIDDNTKDNTVNNWLEKLENIINNINTYNLSEINKNKVFELIEEIITLDNKDCELLYNSLFEIIGFFS